MAKAEANLTEGVLTARPPPCFRPEFMLHFDGDDQATKVRVRSLLDHNFSIVALTQLFSDSDEEEEQQGPGSADFALAEKSGGDSSDEDAPVASLRGRTAAAAARARMSNRSPSASNSSSSAWSPHRRRSATDSSPDISPLAEQPTPPGSQPRRSPRRALAAPAAPAEPHEPHELVEDSSDEETERPESERTKYGAKVVCTTKDKFQPVKSIEWTLADPSKLTDDVREEYPGTFGTKYDSGSRSRRACTARGRSTRSSPTALTRPASSRRRASGATA